MQLSRINTNAATVQGPNNFSIGVGDETEEPIINHFLQAGKKFPFAVGRAPGGSIYFNGFYNYTFSMVFASPTPDTEPTGVVYGIQDDGGFSAIEPLSATTYAVARFNFGDNYLLPNVSIASNDITINTDLEGFAIPELVANAPVKIVKLTQPNTIVYASDTESGQIALLGYNTTASTLTGTKYLGFSNPYHIGAIILTRDGGLAICGLTYVAGRFPRLCLFKIPAEDVNRLAGQ
jgi:hypothetical protein